MHPQHFAAAVALALNQRHALNATATPDDQGRYCVRVSHAGRVWFWSGNRGHWSAQVCDPDPDTRVELYIIDWRRPEDVAAALLGRMVRGFNAQPARRKIQPVRVDVGVVPYRSQRPASLLKFAAFCTGLALAAAALCLL